MVLADSPSPMQINKTTKGVEIPTFDLSCISMNRENLSKLLVKACEEYGFFKVINHGVSDEIISKLDDEGFAFFTKPQIEKETALSPTRFGYGFKNIGRHGDEGELEYLLFQANHTSVFEQSKTISSNPLKFSCAVNNYVEAVQKLACETLDLLAEGLEISDKALFSKLINDVQSDGILRINYFPPFSKTTNKEKEKEKDLCDKLGFGAHTDIQLLTFLRSNEVDGLEISLHDGVWIPISSDPSAFYVMVGDTFKVLTNGRFVSIKHRVIANKEAKARMSMGYFPAPCLDAKISPLTELVMDNQKNLYKPFTYGEFKTHAYSLRLGVSRLDPFNN